MSSDEASRWKQLAEQYKASWLEAKAELEDYQTSSRDLEAELEAQAEQAEARCRELAVERSRLLVDLGALQEKYDKERAEAGSCIAQLQDELQEVRRYRDTLEQYVRELEQTNDDLERAKRETLASLEDFEIRMNQCIERNAFLESELDEKEMLVQLVQRLKDEARDLKQEVDICTRRSESKMNGDHASSSHSSLRDGLLLDDRLRHVPFNGEHTMPGMGMEPAAERMQADPLTSPLSSETTAISPTSAGPGGFLPLSSRAQLSALNIVGDLLSKVGALELKLSQCRNFVKDHHYLHQQEVGIFPLKSVTVASGAPRPKLSLRRTSEPLGSSSSGNVGSNLPVPVNPRLPEAACSDALQAADHDRASAMPNGWRAWFTGKSA